MKLLIKFFLCLIAISAGVISHAAEFRSIGSTAVVMFDAPSTKAKKLVVLGPGYPLEVIVTLSDWSKVRDAHGTIAWVENRTLSTKRTLLVQGSQISVYETPQENSNVVFRANDSLVLDWMESGPAPWIKVKHQDGEIGYLQSNHVWGD